MRSKFASSVLSALLYAQGLLGFAGVTTIVMRDHQETVFEQDAATNKPAPSVW